MREHATHEGWEVLEVVRDEGHSGAYLERPGLDRVRDLVEARDPSVSVVVALDADRITRELGHRMLLDEEFECYGCRLLALDDWGDDSHEGGRGHPRREVPGGLRYDRSPGSGPPERRSRYQLGRECGPA